MIITGCVREEFALGFFEILSLFWGYIDVYCIKKLEILSDFRICTNFKAVVTNKTYRPAIVSSHRFW